MEALKDVSLPEGVFTEDMERVHGRLAMLGLISMLLIETVTGKAVL